MKVSFYYNKKVAYQGLLDIEGVERVAKEERCHDCRRRIVVVETTTPEEVIIAVPKLMVRSGVRVYNNTLH